MRYRLVEVLVNLNIGVYLMGSIITAITQFIVTLFGAATKGATILDNVAEAGVVGSSTLVVYAETIKEEQVQHLEERKAKRNDIVAKKTEQVMANLV